MRLLQRDNRMLAESEQTMKIDTTHSHSWEFIRSKNYGIMNYDSAGGAVDDCILELHRCSFCGEYKVEERGGGMCGDPYTMLEDLLREE